MKRALLLLVFVPLLLLGCRLAPSNPTAQPSPSPTSANTGGEGGSSVSESAAPAVAAAAEIAPEASPSAPPPTATPGFAPPTRQPSRYDPTPISTAEIETFEALATMQPPVRDDVALAQLYQDLSSLPLGASAALTEELSVGTTAPFIVLNIDSNFHVPIEATLQAVSEHAYFWFDSSGPQPTSAELAPVATAFDAIYEQNVVAFGNENRPGIDGDDRLHIVHASPAALCDNANSCGLAGYFSALDALPRAVNENSNERDMFVMNADKFGTDFYVNVLAHEFRHMIEDNYDQADLDWEIEGSAVLAEELAGFTRNAEARGNAFLENPDQQLNRWSEENTLPRYGQGYVLNRYIYDRLGPDLYFEFATHPADGLGAVSAVAAENGLDLDGESLWRDWLAALAIHRHPQRAEQYRLGDGNLGVAAMSTVSAYPQSFEETVNQYAADYYRFEGNGPVTLAFEGSKRVPLLDTEPPSGRHFWYANRANYSHLQMSRRFDLTGVDQAYLNYQVYHDIEQGYDFAYLFVSTDDGATWSPLTAPNMRGLDPVDNPSGNALADRFYTGESGRWITETVDLAPYVGQEIWLRFAYVTDPILTYGGLALDNISIPAIGFYDDAESAGAGWEVDGFTRATATLPQQWHLQMITFPGGVPMVTPLPLDAGPADATSTPSLTYPVNLDASGGEAIVIVAASAPLTLEQAHYRLQFAR